MSFAQRGEQIAGATEPIGQDLAWIADAAGVEAEAMAVASPALRVAALALRNPSRAAAVNPARPVSGRVWGASYHPPPPPCGGGAQSA